MTALWPNGKSTPGSVWHEFGPRKPIWTPNGPTSSFHSGIDIGPWNGAHSTWLLSPVDGVVVHAGYDPIFGNRVVIRGGGADFWLCHGRPRSMQVKVGQRVRQGQRLQLMGETGKASGVHIHYEIHVNGVRVDPRDFYRSGSAAGGSSGATNPEEDDMFEKEDRALLVEALTEIRNTKAGVWTGGTLNGQKFNYGALPIVAHNQTLIGRLTAQVGALSAAVQAMASASGADPDAILSAVEQGVKNAMAGVSFSVDVEG